MRVRLRTASALALVLAATAACATAPGGERPAGATSLDASALATGPAAAYGQFLSAQVAMNRSDTNEASRRFAAATAAAPDQRGIRERAFMTALLAGDVDRAVALAPDSPPSPTPTAAAATPSDSARPPQTPEERRAQADARRTAREAARSEAAWLSARLVRAAQALKAGRGREAVDQLAGDMGAQEPVAAILRPWAAAQAGDWTAALGATTPAGERADGSLGYTRAVLLERRGDRAGAEAAYAALAEDTLMVVARGEFLERTGRAEEAVRLYDASLARVEPPMLRAARARAVARGRPPAVPTFAQGAARALIAPAMIYAGARQHESALLYLRLVTYLDPTFDEAAITAGDTLVTLQDEEGARAEYARVSPEAPSYAIAQSKLVASLQREDRDAEALEIARRAVARAPADTSLRLTLASLMLDERRYDDALAALDGADETEWRVLYARGIAHERAGRWPQAEAALQSALRLRPDDAELLNALGYGWVDRGVRLEEASAMLDRAMQAEPENGAIVDSVGWARYRLGRYDEALRLLERAVQLSPEDPAVNDHLGDVYWRLNRRTEAEYQWRRVLTLEPDAALRTAVEAKLASGRGPTDASAAAAPSSSPATPAPAAPR